MVYHIDAANELLGLSHIDAANESLNKDRRYKRALSTNTEATQSSLVHGHLDLHGRVDLNGGDASDDVHGTNHHTLTKAHTQPDRSLSCGFSSRDAPSCWYPHRKGTCGW